MAKFVWCSLPDGGEIFINVDQVRYVMPIDANVTLVGFGNDKGEGIAVSESPRDILAGHSINEH